MAKRRTPIKKLAKSPAQSTPPIVQQITVRQYNRTSSDLTDWRNANRAAESLMPSRVWLYDLYHDYATTDGQIISVWSKRVDAVTSAQWEFTDSEGEPVEEVNQIIDCLGFDDLLSIIMESEAWGYSACEPSFFINANGQNELSVYNIPKKHLRPETGIIAFEQYGQEGISIREGIYAQTVMEFGRPDNMGLYLSAVMYAILKRGVISDWAEFIEIFGRGIIDAVWDGFDEKQRIALAKAIQEMGGGGVIIRPDGTKVDIKQNTGNATGQLQASFADKMDAYISKVLLGTTETTDSSKSSGYAQAEIHQNQDEKKNNRDITFIRRYLNSKFIPVLQAAGFDTKGGTFVIKKTSKIDKASFEVHKTMRKELKVPIDDDFFYETYGVRKPDDYEKLKKELYDSANNDLPQNADDKIARTPQASADKKDKQPDSERDETRKNLSFFRRLLRLFHSAPTTGQQPIAGAATICCGGHHTIKLAAGFDYLDIEAFARDVWAADGKPFMYPTLFNHYSQTLLKGFESGWQEKAVKLASLGFEYGYTDPKIQTAWELNLFRFSAIRAAYQSAEVNAIFRKAKNFDEFYRTVKKLYGVTDKNHLRTEWDTANAAGESASTYYRLMGQTKVFKYWRYMTVGDDKVRQAHQRLHGCVFRWDDPIWDKIMPPNGWNCRCYIVPVMESEVTEDDLKRSQEVMEEFYNSEGWQAFEKSGFATNMANTKEVFTESQQYSKTPGKVLDNAGQLYYDDWGLKPIQQRQAQASEKYQEADDRKVITDFFTKYKVSNRKAVLEDYKGREITIEKNRLQSHTNSNNSKKPDYANRHKYLPGLEAALHAPDEVWINNDASDRFDTYVYIKYYQNVVIKVICNLDASGNLQINTWYDVRIDDTDNKNKLMNDLYRHRRGLLIKQ